MLLAGTGKNSGASSDQQEHDQDPQRRPTRSRYRGARRTTFTVTPTEPSANSRCHFQTTSVVALVASRLTGSLLRSDEVAKWSQMHK